MTTEQGAVNRKKRGLDPTMDINDSPAKQPRMNDQTLPVFTLQQPINSMPNAQSPMVRDDERLSNLTVHDLNKLMCQNFMQMQQAFMVTMVQTMQTMVPGMVKSSIAEIKNDVKNVTTEHEKLAGEVEKMKTTLVEHQRFLST